MTTPARAALIGRDTPPGSTPIPWEEARDSFAAASTYWWSTASGDHPTLRPVLSVWVDDAPHVSTSPVTRKSRPLAASPTTTLACQTGIADTVVEGTTTRVTDPATLRAVATAYATKYGWSPSVVGDALGGEEGAPTAGPPPYEVYRITPRRAYAFGIDEDHGARSTRWVFPDHS
ncbi:hypothetical protein C1701_00545 [Actinoalloteichus sp. AHMU CJ021]|uniref:hypothetical protein n=1 Tax=Actinoalloteichus TaxID=65496 RepID=UPI00036AC5B7|nr:hypothetical protein [Actinoalloteichus spitiensis]AUS77094.1 hypothetical protein C1701_00545 [Actinoalloteichus sp. AHMU CJ021]